MPEVNFINALATVIVALGGLVGAFAGLRKVFFEARSAKEPPPTPYEVLANRLVQLEQADQRKSTQIGELTESVNELQQRENRLLGWVARLHAGIMDGTIPPLPIIPQWLDDDLASLIAKHIISPKKDN